MKEQLAFLLCAIALVAASSIRGNSDPSQAQAICAADESNSVLVAHEDCHKFYKCAYGMPIALDCPSNLVYNPDLEYCDWPENYECRSTIEQEIKGEAVKEEEDKVINDDPSKAPEICAAEDSDGVLVSHESCKRFYKCAVGVPVALSCPLDLVYNPIKEYCDWADNVKCVDQLQDVDSRENTLPEAESPAIEIKDEKDYEDRVIHDDPSKAPEICAAEESDGVVISHESCNRFYKCFGGVPVPLNCPNDLVFNPVTDYCDWPENYECLSKIIESDQPPANEEERVEEIEKVIHDDPSKAPEVCAEEGSDSSLVAHEDCNKFYKCYRGLPVAIECPLNLLYNPSMEYCDWPFNVECGNRIV